MLGRHAKPVQRPLDAVFKHLLELTPSFSSFRSHIRNLFLCGFRGTALHRLAFLHEGIEYLAAFLLTFRKSTQPGKPYRRGGIPNLFDEVALATLSGLFAQII